MIRKERYGVHWLEFELFEPFIDIEHAIFLRHGGTSTGPYSSLNLSDTMKDDLDAVQKNIDRAKAVLGTQKMAQLNQVHGANVVEINQSNWINRSNGDALMTNDIDIALKITHADCQGAIFYDPIEQVIAAVHCGWRGQVRNIYAKTIEALVCRYGCKPANIFVGIGPSLGPQYAEFKNFHAEFPEDFLDFECSPNYFDLWALAAWQLTSAGILPEHMQLANLCTYSEKHDCFSYRRSQGITGAHASIAQLLRR